MHVRAIARHGEQILGTWDGIEGLTSIRKVSSRYSSGTIDRFSNGHFDGPASPDETKSLPVKGAWGLDYLWVLAERVHVRGLPEAN
jgi:hypothetical protein